MKSRLTRTDTHLHIHNNEQNKKSPEYFAKQLLSATRELFVKGFREVLKAGYSPDGVAEIVFASIARDALYIHTHPELSKVLNIVWYLFLVCVWMCVIDKIFTTKLLLAGWTILGWWTQILNVGCWSGKIFFHHKLLLAGWTILRGGHIINVGVWRG